MVDRPSGEALSARQQTILTAIVGEFIASGQPVGSKTVLEKYGLACSWATIRNEMAALERLGYLSKPHTSAGRVPTQPAYRFYVDRLGSVTEGPSRELTWVHGELSRCGGDLATLLRTSARLLSDMTGQPALAGEPALARQAFTAFRLTPISARSLRVTYESEELGRRELIWESPRPLRGEEIAALSEALAAALCDRGPAEVTAAEIAAPTGLPEELIASLLQVLTESGPERVYVEGAARLLSYPELAAQQRVQELLAALAEERLARALLRLRRTEGLTVLIGSEHGRPRFLDCSLVVGSYHASASPVGQASRLSRGGAGGALPRLGSVAVLGPLRMPYQRAITAVNTIAREIDRLLKVEEEEE